MSSTILKSGSEDISLRIVCDAIVRTSKNILFELQTSLLLNSSFFYCINPFSASSSITTILPDCEIEQVTRKSLPLDVVTVDATVKIKNINTNQVETYTFVAPDKAKRKKIPCLY